MKNLQNLFLLTALCAAPSASAAWSLVDDMEGSNAWTGNSSIVTDPAGGSNQVLAVNQTNQAYLAIPNINEGTTGTIFFRIRASATNADWIWGSSDEATPSAFDSYEGYGRISDDGGALAIDVRNTGASGSFSEVGGASANTWYNVWLVLHNETGTASDTTDLYFNTSGDATSPGTSSFLGANFRNSTTSALVTFLAKNNQDDTTGYLDDLYVDTAGQNLANPIPEPAAGLLGLLGVLGVLRRRR